MVFKETPSLMVGMWQKRGVQENTHLANSEPISEHEEVLGIP